MPESQNEAVVRRFYDELWNDWQLDLADEILSETLRFRGSLGTVCGRRHPGAMAPAGDDALL